MVVNKSEDQDNNKDKTNAKQKASVKKKTTSKKTVKKTPTKKRQSSTIAPWNFPKNTLEESLIVAKSLEEKFAGNPTKADALVKAVGFKKQMIGDFKTFLNLLSFMD